MYKAGIIGLGRIGAGHLWDPKRAAESTHLGSYAALRRFKVVAACDTNPGVLTHVSERTEHIALYRSYDEMFASEKLDIVSVCTPPEYHAEHVIAAALHGVMAVFCEKPLATVIEEGERMVDACRDNNVLLAVNHQRRFSPTHQSMAARARRGELGRVQEANVHYTGGLLHSCTHLIDLLRLYLGDVLWVRGEFSTNPSRQGENDPNIDGTLQFNGGRATLRGLDAQAYDVAEMEIYFTGGRLRTVDSALGVCWDGIQENTKFSDHLILVESPPMSTALPGLIAEGILNLLEALCGRAELLSKGEDGLAALKVIKALHESARSGVAVSLYKGEETCR